MNMPLSRPGLKLPPNEAGEHEMLSGDGLTHAVCLPDVQPAQMFKRRAIKKAGTPEAYSVEWVVVELADGTRVYAEGGRIVVTKQDIMP